MNFVPNTPKTSVDVPYFENATSEQGWQGQTTTKSVDRLKEEVSLAIVRLGGVVTSWIPGKFMVGKLVREGYRINYIIETPDGRMVKGQLDIAALPVKQDWNMSRTLETRKDRSLRMALYMLRVALDGTRFLQLLSPGYSALMPFMLGPGGKTISQLWGESSVMQNLLPPGESEFVEGDYKEL